MASELGGLVGSDTGGDDGAADTTGAAEEGLAGDIDVRHALIFAEERNVQQDGQRLAVGGEDGNLAGSTVQSLGD